MKKHVLLRLVSFLAILVLLFTLVSCDGILGSTTPKTEAELEEESLEQLLFYLKNYSSYPLPADFDPTGLSPAEIVKATNDPFAAYFTAEEYAAYSSDLGGNLVGIGVSVAEYQTEGLTGIHILSVFPDSPAEKAGLQQKDIITAVGETKIADVGYRSALSLVTGEAGTSLTLTYLRDSVETTVTIVRAVCVKETVHGRIIQNGDRRVGYVYITEFDGVTTLQFIETVSALTEAGATAFLFDLRGNPGGYLRSVSEMLAYILPDGDISHIDYGYERLEDYTIRSEGDTLYGIGDNTLSDGSALPVSHSLAHLPIGVLTDGGTASAAELFTSALRDYGNAGKMNVTIVGTKTYGKGSMQSAYRLANGDYVKMTLALYNPPCNINYDGIGITPHVVVETEPLSLTGRHFGELSEIALIDAALYAALTTLS